MTAPDLNVVARLTRALEAWEDGDEALAVQIIEDLRRELAPGEDRER